MRSQASFAAPATALALTLAVASAARSQDLDAFEGRTTVHRLENGWTFVILERPVAPVFSFATYVNAGSVNEVPGITGLAHMFEHMAFKGTPTIGTTDYQAEKKVLEDVEAAYLAYQAERLARRPDEARLGELRLAFERKQEEATRFVVTNEFGDLVDREGGVGMNAFTAADYTGYFYSLPANKLELFAFLESERFLHPVFREFYKERAVVQEERRLRVDSQPFGRLIEQWVATAYVYHPYSSLGIGSMSDLESFTATDAEQFYRTYYAPSNVVTALVGYLDAEKVIPLLEKYFGRIPARPQPPPLRTVEPPQIAEKTVVIEDPAQPYYIESYHIGAITDPDQPVYDAIDDILSRGRTSRLYRALVRDQRIAVEVQSFSGFPGEQYPNLWGVLAIPAPGVANETVQEGVRSELARLAREEVADEELEKFRTRARADLLRQLDDNEGMAGQLARYQLLFGDWRELFRYLDRLDKVTKADVQRVARATFRDANRTVAMIVTTEPEEASGGGEAGAGADEGTRP